MPRSQKIQKMGTIQNTVQVSVRTWRTSIKTSGTKFLGKNTHKVRDQGPYWGTVRTYHGKVTVRTE